MKTWRVNGTNLPRLLAGACLLHLGCGQGQSTDSETINLNPTSQDEATASIAAIGRMERANPQDPRARETVLKLQPALDRINHVVARLEPTPGHVIRFYETAPGVLGISEIGPRDAARLVSDDDVKGLGVVALYRRLAAGTEPPKTLLEAEQRELAYRGEDPQAPQHDGALISASSPTSPSASPKAPTASDEPFAQTSQALTGSDGQFFVDNICFKGGDYRGCLPNWGNGGWVDGYAKTSFLKIAPFAGGTVFVRLVYEGSQVDIEPVFQGDIGSFWAHSSKTWDCCGICACGTSHYDMRHHHWDLVEADGKSFHWTWELKAGSCWDWDCESP